MVGSALGGVALHLPVACLHLATLPCEISAAGGRAAARSGLLGHLGTPATPICEDIPCSPDATPDSTALPALTY